MSTDINTIELTYEMHSKARVAAAAAELLAFNAFTEHFKAGNASTAGLYAEWLVKIARLNCIVHGTYFPSLEGGAL